MAERDGEEIKQDAAAELPAVESPPLSPAGASSEEPVEAETSAEASGETEVSGNDISSNAEGAEEETAVSESAAPRPWLRLSRRHQHRLTLAAWVALVAGLGALFGGAVSNGLVLRDRVDVAGVAQRKAMQQSIDRLARQLGELKTKLAAATAQSQVAKNLTKNLTRNSAAAGGISNADITGTIPTARVASVPLPRPAPRIAAAVSRPAVVHSWRILRSRGGVVAVVGGDGIYEVVPGAVLPGLGPVQSIERRNGRWMVVTPKGIIVSSRDRGYFEPD